MFKRILIPLDGSDLSERALAPAFDIAARYAAEVVLLRVLAPEPAALPAGTSLYLPELAERDELHDRQTALAYLRRIQAQWQSCGVAMQAQVETGAPPEAILQVAGTLDADLIVMSTHGRSGISRLLYGSVAEAVLRGTSLPLLLIPTR